jgi:hypothetical protein
MSITSTAVLNLSNQEFVPFFFAVFLVFLLETSKSEKLISMINCLSVLNKAITEVISIYLWSTDVRSFLDNDTDLRPGKKTIGFCCTYSIYIPIR